DRTAQISLVLCTVIIILAALYFSRAIIAPVTFAIFIVAIAWPLQSNLQARIPKLLALVVTILVTLAVIAVLVYLVVWGFSLVVQWLVNNTGRFQALYAQATEWLDGHGVSITSLVADSYNPGWVISAVREIGGRGYNLISFIVIAFAFIVLGLLEVDVARRNIERLKAPKLRQSLLLAAGDIASKFQKYMVVRSTMSVLTGLVVWSFALVAGIELATAWGVIAFVLNYIPFIGPLIATVFPTLFALVQSGSWQVCFAVFLSLNFIQFFIGSYLEPRIAGAALSISPFIVLLAVFLWSFLWGVAGAFMGVPIIIAILAICERHKSTEWIASLLSGYDRQPA
ncbi:MAG TPA: AI-2E family transporter, partial [Terriglobales bacterium]|nr:AI-2E family transporter [Terriglobales bacterium]